MKSVQIGIGTYALAWSIGVPGHAPPHPMNVLDFIQVSAEVGAKCIQIADNIPLDKMTRSDWIEIHDQAKQFDQVVELGMRGLTSHRLITYLEICQLMNCNLLRVVIDDENHQPSLEDVILFIRDIVPALQDAKVKLAVENHDRFSWVDFLQIAKNTDDKWVGICLDSVNSLGKGEGFFQVAEQLLPYTINLHVKDYKIVRKSHNMGFDVHGTVAGEGMLPIPWLFEQIKKYDRCRTAILELWTPPETTIDLTIKKEREWMKKSMQYLQNIT